MYKQPKYFIVEASALPEVFLKVAEVKHLLSTGGAATVNEATKIMGISRSAFYKYRDVVMPFQNLMKGRIITIQVMIHDEPGTLANILEIFANHKANIQSINSIVPANGVAYLTISADTMDVDASLEDFLRLIAETSGVIKSEVLGG